MATRTTKICDVFGTAKDVLRVHVQLLVPVTDDQTAPPGAMTADLSPRARTRLQRLIERGMNPPSRPFGKTLVEDK